jgi:deoxyribonuclease-4
LFNCGDRAVSAELPRGEASVHLGAHMSIAGGVHLALQRGLSIGCRAVQIFTHSQLQWAAPPLKAEEIEAFRALLPRFAVVFAHGSYLLNLASPDPALFRRSVAGLAEELRRCRLLGIGLLVLHPGAHMGSGPAAGIRRLARGIREAYRRAEAAEVTLALETTSGRGTILGRRFEELRDMLDKLVGLGLAAGICLDTCHVFAAGYELRDRTGYRRTFEQLGSVVGLPALRALHLNDSAGKLASGTDRHAHIGRGRIGLQGFRRIMRDRRLSRLAGVLETPKGPDMREDVRNLAALRSLRRG